MTEFTASTLHGLSFLFHDIYLYFGRVDGNARREKIVGSKGRTALESTCAGSFHVIMCLFVVFIENLWMH